MEFKSKKEWEAAADKMFADGVSPQEINKRIGTYSGPEGTFTIQQAAKSKRGFTVVDKDKRKKRNEKRKAAIAEQDAKLVDTLLKGGMSEEEAREILEKEKAGYERIEQQAKNLNKEFGKGAFNAGHETAALEGGGNYGRNARIEIGKSRVRTDGTVMRGNQSRGRIDEAPDNIKPVMGIPRSGRGGEDTALHNLLEQESPELMDTGLTPKDRQDIKRNPELADDIFQARQDKINKLNVKGGTVRLNPKALAAAGLALPSVFGTAASAMETAERTKIAMETGNPLDQAQAGLAGLSLAGDAVPVVGEAVSTPADLLNFGIDEGREAVADPIGYTKSKAMTAVQAAGSFALGVPAMKAINGGMKLLFK